MMSGVGLNFEMNPNDVLPSNVMANKTPDNGSFENFDGGINGFLNSINNGRLASSSIPLEILDKTGLIKYCQMLQEFVVRLQAGREFSECTTWSRNDGMENQDKCKQTHREVCNRRYSDLNTASGRIEANGFLGLSKSKILCSFCRTKHKKGFMYCPSYGTCCDFCQKLNHSLSTQDSTDSRMKSVEDMFLGTEMICLDHQVLLMCLLKHETLM